MDGLSTHAGPTNRPQTAEGRLSAVARAYRSPRLGWALVVLGGALRVRQFAANRSLWHDEAALALNIINRSWAGLLQPLDYNQGAPPGFLLATKSCTAVLGHSEYALRLVPLLCALSSLLFFRAVAKRLLPALAVPFALLLFAVSWPLLRYASEAKQYSSDVLVALVLFWLVLRALDSGLSGPSLVVLGGAGMAAVWFSHPSVFILGAAGVALALRALDGHGRSRRAAVAALGLVWLASFGLCYSVSLRFLAANRYLLEFWREAFMPLPPTSLAELGWFARAGELLMTRAAGLGLPWLALPICVAGGIVMTQQHRRAACLILLPVAFALLASGLQRYPFGHRLLLFLAPTVVLPLSFGAERAGHTVCRQWGRGWGIAAALLLGALLLGRPLRIAALVSLHPVPGEQLRPILAELDERARPGDTVYVYYAAEPALLYYRARFPLNGAHVIIGTRARSEPGLYLRELDRLAGRERVWVVLSHPYEDEFGLLRSHLDQIGRPLARLRRRKARLWLYDLSMPPEGRALPAGS